MKIYIHTDIEGVAGWVFYASDKMDQANLDHVGRMNRLLTGEVVAACRAALDMGADEVLVNDAHGSCYNIEFELLPTGCRYIGGRPGYFDHWLACFDKSIDALICIGQHAMAATPRAVCPHSMWHLNGQVYSETTMAAALAGAFGVPCIAVSGDEAICRETIEKIPRVETIVVKRGLSSQNACSLCPTESRECVYQGVRRAIDRRHEIAPLIISGPYHLNLSNRDPAVLLLSQPVIGDDLWQTTRRALNSLPYGHYGQDPIDDYSFRYPN
jgi:D-amino peptidase